MESEATGFSPRRSALIMIVAILLALLLAGRAALPIQRKVAERYVGRGDAYLAGQEFEEAAEQYRRALAHDGGNQEAASHLVLAEKAPTDIAVAADFFAAHGVLAVTQKLERAKRSYDNPKEAVQAGIDFFAAGDYVYAQYPLQRAVALDPGYPEAWHYLGLTYRELAAQDPALAGKAAEAFSKRDHLTPNYVGQ